MRPSREDLNRAYYLSTRRSTAELEQYLGKFYANRALSYCADKLHRYLRVLEMDDKILQQVLIEGREFPEGSDAEMLHELKEFNPSASRQE